MVGHVARRPRHVVAVRPVLPRIVEPLRVGAGAEAVRHVAGHHRDRDSRAGSALSPIDADDGERLRIEERARAAVDLSGELARRTAHARAESPSCTWWTSLRAFF